MNDATHHAVVFSTDSESISQNRVVMPVQPVDKLRRLLPFHWNKFHASPPFMISRRIPRFAVLRSALRLSPVNTIGRHISMMRS